MARRRLLDSQSREPQFEFNVSFQRFFRNAESRFIGSIQPFDQDAVDLRPFSKSDPKSIRYALAASNGSNRTNLRTVSFGIA